MPANRMFPISSLNSCRVGKADSGERGASVPCAIEGTMAVAKTKTCVTGSPASRAMTATENQALETEPLVASGRTGAQEIRSRCTLVLPLHIWPAGSPLATFENPKEVPLTFGRLKARFRRASPASAPPPAASANQPRRRARLPRISRRSLVA